MADWHVLIDRNDLRNVAVVDATPGPLTDGQVRLRVDAFGFTANNVTYAAIGDLIGYWNFFPAPDRGDDVTWGRVPVWGFADVVESRCAGVSVGERVFGYLPMSTELVIEPGQLSAAGLTDMSAHRADMPAVYNQFSRCAGDASYNPADENMQMLFRPLFFTSFLIDDFLDDNGFFAASTVVLTSASSKTAFGTAHLLHQREGVTVIGLTSQANLDFVDGLGCYDSVVTYDEIASLPDGPTVLLDFSGNPQVVAAVHQRYGDQLAHSAIIGVTHWEERTTVVDAMPGPAQEMFFAPTQIDKRRAEWGPGEVEQRLGAAWGPFIERAKTWLSVVEGWGPDAIVAVYADTLEGNTRPDTAHVLHP